MISRRLLYLNTHQLTAYYWQAGRLTEEDSFEMHEAGHQRFAAYLQAQRRTHFQLLANVSEEGFQLEVIPFLRGEDRQAFIKRKIGQNFLGTPLAMATSLGYERDRRKNEKLLLSALTNATHFSPWLKAMAAADAPLAGIYTVAQLGGLLLKKLHRPATRCLLLTQQDHSIRETYLVNGQTLFSRMAPVSDSSIAGIASSFAAEAAKLLQYLVGQRLVSRNDILPVYVIAHPQAIPTVRAACQDSGNLIFELLDCHQQAKTLNLKSLPDNCRCDWLFLHLLAIAPPRLQFANEDHRHDYRISQLRTGLIALGIITFLASALFSARGLYQTYTLQEENQALMARTAEMNFRYGEISATFPQIGIDNDSLRRLTDHYAELKNQQRLPAAAFHQISLALDQSPAIYLETLDWRVNGTGGAAVTKGAAQQRPRDNPPPALVSGDQEIITLTGQIRLEATATTRHTLAALEQFAQLLAVDRQHQVDILQQPIALDASQALRGGDKEDSTSKPRSFSIQITRPLTP